MFYFFPKPALYVFSLAVISSFLAISNLGAMERADNKELGAAKAILLKEIEDEHPLCKKKLSNITLTIYKNVVENCSAEKEYVGVSWLWNRIGDRLHEKKIDEEFSDHFVRGDKKTGHSRRIQIAIARAFEKLTDQGIARCLWEKFYEQIQKIFQNKTGALEEKGFLAYIEKKMTETKQQSTLPKPQEKEEDGDVELAQPFRIDKLQKTEEDLESTPNLKVTPEFLEQESLELQKLIRIQKEKFKQEKRILDELKQKLKKIEYKKVDLAHPYYNKMHLLFESTGILRGKYSRKETMEALKEAEDLLPKVLKDGTHKELNYLLENAVTAYYQAYNKDFSPVLEMLKDKLHADDHREGIWAIQSGFYAIRSSRDICADFKEKAQILADQESERWSLLIKK
jgi:hypothetical protein